MGQNVTLHYKIIMKKRMKDVVAVEFGLPNTYILKEIFPLLGGKKLRSRYYILANSVQPQG